MIEFVDLGSAPKFLIWSLRAEKILGLFRFFPPPSPTGKIIISPLADMLS